ncbi:MAG: hypothetical protein ACRDE2_07245, partial [Chitinophagaceae bacterium]
MRIAKENDSNKKLIYEKQVQIKKLQYDKTELINDIDSTNLLKNKKVMLSENIESEIKKLREKFSETSNLIFDGNENCSMCGQRLPDADIDKLKKDFLINQQNRMAEIRKAGLDKKDQLENTKDQISSLEVKLKEFNETLNDLNKQILERKEILENTTSYFSPNIIIDDQKIKAIDNEIESLSAYISDGSEDTLMKDLKNKRDILQKELMAVNNRLVKKTLIEEYLLEIENLKEKGKDITQHIVDIEKEEFIMLQFSKTRSAECERRINGLFEYVTFKLFDVTQDGNEFETCIPFVDGVPYSVQNNASQINAGLDVIRQLSYFYSITPPIFIDNRESVNEIILMKNQIINLVVTKEQNLNITNHGTD